jgi:hypothetical protein
VLVGSVFEHLQSAIRNRRETESRTSSEQKELEESKRQAMVERQNLLHAIKATGGIQSIYDAYNESEAKITRIDERLASLSRPPIRDIRIGEVRDFVHGRLEYVGRLLTEQPERLKEDFQRRVKNIILLPSTDSEGRVFEVTGDVDLFCPPDGVVQQSLVDQFCLHYTLPIRIEVASCRKNRTMAARAA